MHVQWAMCPNAYKGQFTSGYKKAPTLVLEAVADWNGWIWHSNFGYPGAMNDINVWDRSTLNSMIATGEWKRLGLDVTFEIGNEEFNE